LSIVRAGLEVIFGWAVVFFGRGARSLGINKRSALVVESAGEYSDFFALHLINEPMGLVDAARPATFQLSPKRFCLANPFKGIALRVSQELRPQGFRSRGPWHRVIGA
jgi:hypothetical protein